jgi:hypothetical protein
MDEANRLRSYEYRGRLGRSWPARRFLCETSFERAIAAGGAAVDPPQPPEDGRHASATEERSISGGSSCLNDWPELTLHRLHPHRYQRRLGGFIGSAIDTTGRIFFSPMSASREGLFLVPRPWISGLFGTFASCLRRGGFYNFASSISFLIEDMGRPICITNGSHIRSGCRPPERAKL